MCRENLRNFVLIAILAGQRTFALKGNQSEARLVPPPPPFAPPLLFPVNAATGILVAIAVPVPLHEQNVFVSYNFEANYNMPNLARDSIPGPLIRLNLNDPYPSVDASQGGTDYDVIARNIKSDSDYSEDETTTLIADDVHEVTRRSFNDKILFTRTGAYHLIESRLDASGVSGKKCLLLAICETSKLPLLDNNGVVGHVIHVILTPSSSEDENLPLEYMKAELLGASGNCKKYEKQCNFNILNLISKVL